ncbi:MAG: UPF0179 family protein, partial [Methanosarcinaceae archaeon]|nr:UPF0179 family protein [Methanosarcinaceae archaeon]
MTDTDSIITLIGPDLTKESLEFIFEGEAPECNTCKLKNTCMSLEKGRRYQISKILNETVHNCPLHDGGARVVEVIMAPIIAAIDSKNAIKGAKIKYSAPKYDGTDSEIYDLCHPLGLKDGDKCTISEILGTV